MKNSDLLKRNPLYAATYQQMMGYQYAYLGGYIFKQYVRKKRPSEDAQLWNDLIQNSVALPLARYVVDTINDVLFEPGVKRIVKFATPTGQFINPDNAEWVDLFMNDADLNNRSLSSFMEHIGDLTSIFGHCWVAVDMPMAGEGNLGRPYVCAMSPVDVWDWHFCYYGGKPLLDYVKVKEQEDDVYYYIKTYHLGDETKPSYWCNWRVSKKQQAQLDSSAEMLATGTFPLGMSLPIFIAYGRRDPRIIDLGVSDIDAATDAQREIFKLECEAYTALQFAHTIIRADKGINIPVHAGAIVRGTQGQVEAIKIDTGDVEQIIKKQADIMSNLEALTGLGGLRKQSQQVASGIAIVEERKQLHRIAKSKARLMEVTEGLIMTYAARFMGMRWAGLIDYNTDYEVYDTQYRMALIQQAVSIGGDNEIIKSLITKELIGMLAPQEDAIEYEQVYIDTLPNGQLKNLMTEEQLEIFNDSSGGIPQLYDLKEQEEDTGVADEEPNNGLNQGQSPGPSSQSNQAILGGPGTPITPMGPSYYPQQAVAVQITGLNTGR